MASAIYEIRLFLDSPRRVFSSQGRLLASSFGYIAYLLPSLFVMGLPLGLLYLHLEPRYGLDALPSQEPVVVTIDVDSEVSAEQVVVGAEQTGLKVTAPTVFSPSLGQAFVRVEIEDPTAAELRVDVAGETITKRLAGGVHSDERRRGLSTFWAMGWEPQLPGNTPVSAITVAHPSADQRWFGLPVPWWVIWLAIATIAALMLRRPMGVVL
jgi:hypothetical protein